MIKRHKNKGITLLETLIAIAIFGIITVALFSAISHIYRTYHFTWQAAESIAEARRGIKVILREVRAANIGEDGSFVIEKASATEFIFYSDIDRDGETERVRYFLGTSSSGEQNQECASFSRGGSCSVNFSDFLTGEAEQVQVQVGVEGDLGWPSLEIVDVFVDGTKMDTMCLNEGECSDCPGEWQDITIFDVSEYANDNYLTFIADSSYSVDPICDWQEGNHSIKVKFDLTWIEEGPGQDRDFKKGVIQPQGNNPVEYPSEQEEIVVISHYVENVAAGLQDYIFQYFDKDGQLIENPVQRIEQTQLMEISLLINVDPSKSPEYYRLQTSVQLRNLKKEE
ncbi:type II secretion system GspH family protein [Patescibacteria group bacterium]|nr:type II secretion system GspH family protein [Patescibacteria group bacterium]MBU4023105.1 type II secretion system GspH family protein [Patescibacteria group bacterium]MBU4078349.1 type II secretion system GspH family protein [Patescibacteria group bacterium]